MRPAGPRRRPPLWRFADQSQPLESISMSTSIRVRTGSRLHFGILSWNPDLPRQFGGAGVMTDEPGIELSLESARVRTASGPLADRALGFARLLSADGRPE